LVAISVDHRNQEWCSRLSLTDASVHALLADLNAHSGFAEAAVLATCNRVELYAVTAASPPSTTPSATLANRLLHAAGLDSGLSPPLTEYVGAAAAHHLARVASGLESMLLGETEILGQVAAAADAAVVAASSGPTLRLLFQHAVRAGKRSRTETAISRHALSVGALAVNHAEKLVPDLAAVAVTVIGTGLGARLVLAALKTRNAAQVTIVSKDPLRARAEADSWGATAASRDDIVEVLGKSRVAFTATDGDAVIDRAYVTAAVADRAAGDELLLIDIAAPSNVGPGVAQLPHVTLRGLADLGEESARALALRRQEVPAVEAIVDHETAAFLASQREARAHPVVAAWRRQAEDVRERELERALRELNGIGPEVRDRIAQLSRSIVNNLLHEPTARLRAAGENGTWEEHSRVIRGLFGLDSVDSRDAS
jgi:glutamyl-tRNA reductase